MHEPMSAMTPLLASVLSISMLASADLAPKTTFAKPDGALVATLSGVDGPCELVLLDHAAAELARASAAPGDVDLAQLFPAIRAAERAVRVQAIVAGAPVRVASRTATSSWVRTDGSRFGLRALTTSSILSSGEWSTAS